MKREFKAVGAASPLTKPSRLQERDGAIDDGWAKAMIFELGCGVAIYYTIIDLGKKQQ